MAYLSLILAGRDDDYGGDQKRRLQCFINYVALFDRRYRGLLELVVCDWNPPSAERTLAGSFEWSKLEDVSIISVPPELHGKYAGDSGYPILDYIARNVAIRNSRSEFVCVLNQDIYPTDGIMSFILDRRLDPSCFYRADRCDFVPDFELMGDAERVEDFARSTAFQLHRRHGWPGNPIDIPIEPGARPEDWPGSVAIAGEDESHSPVIISDRKNSVGAGWATRARRYIVNQARKLRQRRDRGSRGWGRDQLYLESGLHTNACGDFVIASKKAFGAVRGFVETNQFYMHLDSYGMVQLKAAGYRQAIFRLPNAVFHADHDRAAREGRRESYTMRYHANMWLEMLEGKRVSSVNGPDWGLAAYSLPTLRLRYGKRVGGASPA